MKNNIIRPKFCPSIIGHAAAVGKKERDGPLGHLFDYHDESDRFGQKTWELSEGEEHNNIAQIPASFGNREPTSYIKGGSFTMVRFNFDMDMSKISVAESDL